LSLLFDTGYLGGIFYLGIAGGFAGLKGGAGASLLLAMSPQLA